MKTNLVLKEMFYSSEMGAIKIYEAVYCGEECYCMEHSGSGAALLFDYDLQLAKGIVNKARRTGITVDHKRCGLVFKFIATEREHSISLRTYLYAKYKGVPLRSVSKERIELHDRSAQHDNIYDFRSCNLYGMGNQEEMLEVRTRPNHPEEKYIFVKVEDRIEILDYSEELYSLLNSKAVTIGVNDDTGRINVGVHYDHHKGNDKFMNLSRFVLMFYTFFERYRHMKGAQTRFIKAIPKFIEDMHRFDCAHIDANTWNHTSSNIMFMPKSVNNEMRDFIKDLLDEYGVNTIILPQEGYAILVEIQHKGGLYYFRCDTPEDYCDFQKQLLGKTSVLEDTSATRFGGDMLTPKQVRDKNGREGNKDFDIWDFWKKCDARDRLQSLYNEAPSMFMPWKKNGEGGVNMAQAAYISYVVDCLPIPDRAFYQMFLNPVRTET